MSFVVVALLILRDTSATAANQAKEHPLLPVIRVALDRYRQLEYEIQDYTCTFVKRERIGGRLLEHEHMFVKLRHQQIRNGRVVVPFAVYVRFLGPVDLRGREVTYVRGRNRGKMIVRNGGQRFAYVTAAVYPQAEVAMRRNHYPLPEIGIKNLIMRLLEVAEEDLQHGECQVDYYSGAKVNGRTCTVMQVTHPVPRDHFRYHIARIFIDDELRLPIRYASYDWPEKQGGGPRLVEEYSYLNLRLNVGLTDWDFDHRNPEYSFRKDFQP